MGDRLTLGSSSDRRLLLVRREAVRARGCLRQSASLLLHLPLWLRRGRLHRLPPPQAALPSRGWRRAGLVQPRPRRRARRADAPRRRARRARRKVGAQHLAARASTPAADGARPRPRARPRRRRGAALPLRLARCAAVDEMCRVRRHRDAPRPLPLPLQVWRRAGRSPARADPDLLRWHGRLPTHHPLQPRAFLTRCCTHKHLDLMISIA
mmetsp:Transcript_27773/g.93319  ORF Transcript_27773/g.93319 Transcript_27773/m.93319 type:complete len:210 (+) Transcript_27773:758-1387(+)